MPEQITTLPTVTIDQIDKLPTSEELALLKWLPLGDAINHLGNIVAVYSRVSFTVSLERAQQALAPRAFAVAGNPTFWATPETEAMRFFESAPVQPDISQSPTHLAEQALSNPGAALYFLGDLTFDQERTSLIKSLRQLVGRSADETEVSRAKGLLAVLHMVEFRQSFRLTPEIIE